MQLLGKEAIFAPCGMAGLAQSEPLKTGSGDSFPLNKGGSVCALRLYAQHFVLSFGFIIAGTLGGNIRLPFYRWGS